MFFSGNGSGVTEHREPLGSGRTPALIEHVMSYDFAPIYAVYKRVAFILCERKSLRRAKIKAAEKAPACIRQMMRQELPPEVLRLIFEFSAPPTTKVVIATFGSNIVAWRVLDPVCGQTQSISFESIPVHENHTEHITCIVHSRHWGSGRFVSSSKGGTMRLWRPCIDKSRFILKTEKVLSRGVGYATHLMSIGQGQLASAHRDGHIAIWDLGLLKDKFTISSSELIRHRFSVSSQERSLFDRRIQDLVKIPLDDQDQHCLIAAVYSYGSRFDIWDVESGVRIRSDITYGRSSRWQENPCSRIVALCPETFLQIRCSPFSYYGEDKLWGHDWSQHNRGASSGIKLWSVVSGTKDNCHLQVFDLILDDPCRHTSRKLIPLRKLDRHSTRTASGAAAAYFLYYSRSTDHGCFQVYTVPNVTSLSQQMSSAEPSSADHQLRAIGIPIRIIQEPHQVHIGHLPYNMNITELGSIYDSLEKVDNEAIMIGRRSHKIDVIKYHFEEQGGQAGVCVMHLWGRAQISTDKDLRIVHKVPKLGLLCGVRGRGCECTLKIYQVSSSEIGSSEQMVVNAPHAFRCVSELQDAKRCAVDLTME